MSTIGTIQDAKVVGLFAAMPVALGVILMPLTAIEPLSLAAAWGVCLALALVFAAMVAQVLELCSFGLAGRRVASASVVLAIAWPVSATAVALVFWGQEVAGWGLPLCAGLSVAAALWVLTGRLRVWDVGLCVAAAYVGPSLATVAVWARFDAGAPDALAAWAMTVCLSGVVGWSLVRSGVGTPAVGESESHAVGTQDPH